MSKPWYALWNAPRKPKKTQNLRNPNLRRSPNLGQNPIRLHNRPPPAPAASTGTLHRHQLHQSGKDEGNRHQRLHPAPSPSTDKYTHNISWHLKLNSIPPNYLNLITYPHNFQKSCLPFDRGKHSQSPSFEIRPVHHFQPLKFAKNTLSSHIAVFGLGDAPQVRVNQSYMDLCIQAPTCEAATWMLGPPAARAPSSLQLLAKCQDQFSTVNGLGEVAQASPCMLKEQAIDRISVDGSQHPQKLGNTNGNAKRNEQEKAIATSLFEQSSSFFLMNKRS